MLMVVGGLPGVGKTTLARDVAGRLRAVYLRIDSLEQAMRSAGVERIDGAGYAAAQAAAVDNLRLGHVVVAECVNPWDLTRDAWRQVAADADVRCVEVEVVCSDLQEHRRRVETRRSDIEGLVLPTWGEVVARDYHAWNRDRVVVDTAGRSPPVCVEELLGGLDP